MKGIRIVIAAAIVVLSLASAIGANAAADPTTPNFEEASGPLDATAQPLPQAVPGKATLASPTGIILTHNPEYQWNKVSGSTWYYLWINGPSGTVFKKWYTAEEVACHTICAIRASPLTLGPGTYNWWIQTWNDEGYGPWSDPMSFQISANSGFYDDFDGTLTPPWQPVAGIWNVANGYLQSNSANLNCPSMKWNSIRYVQPYTGNNFYVVVSKDISTKSTDSVQYVGLIVCGSPDPLDPANLWDSGYYFLIDTESGKYLVWKIVGGIKTFIQFYTESDAIIKGNSWNKLHVLCSGSTLEFYINGQQVWGGSDTSLSSGYVGLANFDDGGNFRAEYAYFNTPTYGTPTSEISPEQQKLNEDAWLKYNNSTSEQSLISSSPILKRCPNC